MRYQRLLLKSGGFTLVESLIAIALVTLAVSGPFLAAERAYVSAMDANNRFMASYLAQEGLEYVHMLRDNTYLADYQAGVANISNTAFYNDFLDGVSGAPSSVFGCESNGYPSGNEGGDGQRACALDQTLAIGVDPDTTTKQHALQLCPRVNGVDVCPALYLTGGQYKLSGSGTPSIFTRSIKFYFFGKGVEVDSTVSWSYHGVLKSVVLKDYLMPWE